MVYSGEGDLLLTCMQTHVYLHAARSGEALEAALTLEGLDTRVRFHMCCEGALDSKRSEALFALERLLVSVDADMANKVAGLLELLGAVRAAVPADAVLLPDGAWRKEDRVKQPCGVSVGRQLAAPSIHASSLSSRINEVTYLVIYIKQHPVYMNHSIYECR